MNAVGGAKAMKDEVKIKPLPIKDPLPRQM
jgi:hypothetical protein